MRHIGVALLLMTLSGIAGADLGPAHGVDLAAVEPERVAVGDMSRRTSVSDAVTIPPSAFPNTAISSMLCSCSIAVTGDHFAFVSSCS